MTARNIDEARYVVAIMNSPEVLSRITPLQARGQTGPRDFDNLVWELPVSDYDSRIGLHNELVFLAAEAEQLAADVRLDVQMHYTGQRRVIRDALTVAGLTSRIDALVLRLLDG